LKKVVVLEGDQNGLKEALEAGGYRVFKPGEADVFDAAVVTGQDLNVLGMQDISSSAVVIDARGKTAREILLDLKNRLPEPVE